MEPALTAAHAAPQTMAPGVLDRGVLAGTLALPVVALTVPVPEMFDTTNGLVNRPSKADEDHASVPCAMEWFAPGETQTAFSQAGSLTVGSHKFIVEFGHTTDDYGALQATLFPPSQTTRFQFDVIVLRRPDDPPLGYLKLCHDLWVNETLQTMGLYNPFNPPAPRGPGGGWHRRGCRAVHVFVNGLYWGVSHLTERIDNDFWATRLEQLNSFKQFQASQNGFGINPPPSAGMNPEAASAVEAASAAIPALTAGMESPPLWVAVNKEIDIDELIDYLLLVWFNDDNPSDEQSCRMVRWLPQTGGWNDHAWRFFPSDPENRALRQLEQPPTLPFATTNAVQEMWPPLTNIISGLMAIPLFKQHLRDRALHHLGADGALSALACHQRWQSIQTEIRKDLWSETARWSRQSATQVSDAWNNEMNTVSAYFSARSPALLQNILDYVVP